MGKQSGRMFRNINKIKKVFTTIFIIFCGIFFAQTVALSKVVKPHDNTDKFLYKVPCNNSNSEYLGEIEVAGFSEIDTEVFAKIYKKAKSVGANTFSVKPIENIDGTIQKFNPQHYFLNLYYTEAKNLMKDNNAVYIISSSRKPQKIAINDKPVVFPERSFMKLKIAPNETYTVSTRKLFGSGIKLLYNENQPMQFFQISGFKIAENPYGTAGINLKSGDIIKLEQSYAEFLTSVYSEIK